jgi:NAD(P)-dependent dehydrogenase (short-subunit alcohol dehydrogenase family)
MEYTGKIVVVTGAANGIGKCVSETYAQRGATVVLADKDKLMGEKVEASIIADKGKALFVKTDVSSPQDIDNLFKTVAMTFGKIDILINNAGVSRWKSPYELSVEEWDEIIHTNLRSIFLCSREAARMMCKNGGGSIINIASTRALMSEPHTEAYAASKGGVLALTHALAASFASDKIQVNAISPGWIETGDYNGLRQEDHLQHFSGRVGRPEDIAQACLFLTAENNNFVNGTNLIIDGGMTKKMIYEE